MRALSLVLLLAACHDRTPTGMDDLAPPPPAGDMAMPVDQLSTMDLTQSDPNTFGCDYRLVSPSTNYCQDTTTKDPTVRATYESGCIQNKGELLPAGCPHFSLGGCRTTTMIGSVPVTITNSFVTYPGVTTPAQLATACANSGGTYDAP